MKDIYRNKYSNKYNMDLEKNPRIKIMVKLINELKLKNKNILDIGCYDGTLLSQIKNNNLFGIEASDWAVQKCQQKNINCQKFYWNDHDKIPFQDNFFDVIIAGEIIEHIFDTDFFLEEIKRILKPNSPLFVSTPNIASLGRRLMLLFGLNPFIETSASQENSGHIRYFTFKSLERLFKKHGLKIIKSKSDLINFSNNKNVNSKCLAKIFPALGQSIIVLARKK